MNGPEDATGPLLRQKRHQVSKACVNCRARRIKCDQIRPCRNCNLKGVVCKQREQAQARPGSDTQPQTERLSLQDSERENDALRRQISELQKELQQCKTQLFDRDSLAVATPQSLASALSPHGSPQESLTSSSAVRGQLPKKHFWEGCHLRPPRSPNASWFGPSSLYDFARRFGAALGSQAHGAVETTDEILPASKSDRLPGLSYGHAASVQPEAYLSPIQEQYFISLFWESYNTCVFPIVDEAEFKEHHQSLWTGGERKPSALVDIIVALCMQSGVSALPASQQGALGGQGDAAVSGCWHYRRCQSLLAQEMDSPTLSTLRCLLLSAIYQCGGNFHNLIDTTLGLAVKTAYALGLHVDVAGAGAFSEKEKQMRRTMWWAVFVIDTKIGMKLGRPFLLRDSHVMPRLPGDTLDAARLSGSTLGLLGSSITWLSFNLHHITLYQVIREAFNTLYDTDLGLSPDGESIWDTPHILEAYSDFLRPSLAAIDAWASSIPTDLKTARQGSGNPLSTDGSPLAIEPFSPAWLQRQRLLLEAAYHHQVLSLLRPFISFGAGAAGKGGADGAGAGAGVLAERCAAHADALIGMVHQVVMTTGLLAGWHEIYQWLWNAALTFIGYLFVSGMGVGQTTTTVSRAVEALEVFGESFSVAKDAANTVRSLASRVDSLKRDRGQGPDDPAETSGGEVENIIDWSAWTDQSLLDMTMGVDFWGDLGELWPDSSIPRVDDVGFA